MHGTSHARLSLCAAMASALTSSVGFEHYQATTAVLDQPEDDVRACVYMVRVAVFRWIQLAFYNLYS